MREMKAYSQDLRDRIIDLYEKYQYTKTALSELFNPNYGLYLEKEEKPQWRLFNKMTTTS